MRHLFLIFFAVICILPFTPTSAQNNHQVTIISENDGYISVNNDGYYTNGLKIAYQWQKPYDSSSIQKINTIQIGQLIYNARFTGELDVKKLDRPITGYLYAHFHQKRYSKKQNLLQWGIEAGAIGPPALGEEVQTKVHKLVQIYPPEHWELQLRAEWGIGADVLWSPQIINRNKTSAFDIKPILSATAGNLFTNARLGTAFVLGKFNHNNATVFWNNHSGSLKKHREYIFYTLPSVYFKAYDATVQGGLFKKGAEKIEGRLNPVFFQSKTGFLYSSNKFFIGFAAIYENKQSLTQVSDQWYGSIQAGCMW